MALDTGSAKESLFGGLKKKENPTNGEIEKHEQEKTISPVLSTKYPTNLEASNNGKPKWQTFDKVTVLLTTAQKEGLDRTAKKLMKHRSQQLKGSDDKERITANTLIRALIENFLYAEESSQTEILSSENDVHAWIKKLFK